MRADTDLRLSIGDLRQETLMLNENGVDQTDFIQRGSSVHRRYMPADNHSKGMQTIERTIIERVRNAGRHITAADFTWHHGRVVADMTDVEIRIGLRAVVGIFSWDEIEDAADRVDRPETLRTVQRIIAEAGQLPL